MSKNAARVLDRDAAGPVRPAARAADTQGGKVIHDARGNAVWDWAVATGVLAGAKSAELLRMLDDPALALEGECALDHDWAGDPYNRR
jgi:hypothetical protein